MKIKTIVKALFMTVLTAGSISEQVGAQGVPTNSPSPSPLPTFTVTDLGTLGGATSVANAINNLGQIVGGADDSNGVQKAFLWTNGVIQDLGTLGGSTSVALGLNTNGQIVGDADTTGGNSHGFLWVSNSMSDLGVSSGGTWSQARAINASGQIVGQADDGTAGVAYIYTNGSMHSLGTFGGPGSVAFGINDNGQVVGLAQTGPSTQNAFLYSNGSMSNIAGFQADIINNSGEIVGQSGQDGPACFWLNGSFTNIGYLSALGINSFGEIIIYSYGNTALLYFNGTVTNLNDLVPTNSGWTLQYPTWINDLGQIVGQGVNSNGQEHAFLLTPNAPMIIYQPVSATVAIGSTANLSVVANTTPATYQWYFGTSAISGATNAGLTLTNVQSTQSGSYTVTVANGTGSVTSSAASLSVLPALTINMVPAIGIAGTVGTNYELQYVNVLGDTNAWTNLANITLTNDPEYYFDTNAIGQPTRFYRLVSP